MEYRMLHYYGVRIDEQNTAFIKEYPGCFRDEAMSECMCVGTDPEDMMTVADALNERLSGGKTYVDYFDYKPENFYTQKEDDALGKTVSHPAYGMLAFARRSGGRGEALFGSSIEHRDTISITLRAGDITRGLNNDWYNGMTDLYEIEMSYAQFADAITSLNVGSGTPCTIRYIKGVGRLPNPEFESKRDLFTRELEQQLKDGSEDAKALYDDISVLFATKQSISKKDREQILEKISRIVNSFDSHAAFSFKQYQEQMTRTVHEAKCEVEAFAQNKLLQIAQCALVEHRDELAHLQTPVDLSCLEEKQES